jgi:hypothetical protein
MRMETENPAENLIHYKSDFRLKYDYEEALIAYQFQYTSLNEKQNSAPIGWTNLGHGASRTVLLSPSGIVYKVHNYVDENSNLTEYDTAMRIFDIMPANWAVPAMGLYTILGTYITTMQYIEGSQHGCELFHCPITDHSFPHFVVDMFDNCNNYITNSAGINYAVDLGEGIDYEQYNKYLSLLRHS